tara:strand:- start:3298 stop:5631 length:2334 start_codon:yes stop_codon:yes gene_type:complete
MLLACLAFISGISAQKIDSKNKQSKSIDSLTNKMSQNKGLITTYLNEENKLFFEIDSLILNKDLLVVTRIAQIPANYSPYSNAGSKTAQQVIRFSKKGNKILWKQLSFSNVASEKDPISLSVAENNFQPIIAAFEIKNIEKNRFLIDVSEYYLKDSPGFNIIRETQKEKYKIGGVDKKRSLIDCAKSFPQNTEILHTLTFSASKVTRANPSKTFTFQINHSFIALSDNPMKIRHSDKRIGWFSIKKIDYSSNALKSDEIELIRRWRLEPKDPEAYKRGELVEPIKPIIYYLDPATPIKWRPYFKQGIEDWNTAFEKAGFKNAILAKDPPNNKEDPDFSPEDIRYSTIRYVASTTRNAVGPSVSDPRTGEIIESDIIWYHNHLRSYRNRYLLETGAANPKARTLDTPEIEIGEMMRRVISHEVGHALGLPHNMKASSAYPVDSLRSGTFTQKMGIATTIMDYARYNYVAQQGDQNIRFVRQLGPYDDYAIEWGYRYYGNKEVEKETKILKAYVDTKSLNPIYMFGGSGNDPDSQTENIGDDPVKASDYGIRNLKIVAKNLAEWTLNESSNYDDLEELYDEMIGVYRRYIYHVHRIIGGVNTTLHNSNQNEVFTYTNTSKVDQIRALNFLNEELWNTPKWLIDKTLISNIKAEGGLNTIQNLQRSALNRILSKKLLNRILSTSQTLVGNGLEVNIILQKLFDQIFVTRTKPDSFERALQLNFITQIKNLINDDELHPEIKSSLKMLKKNIHKWSKSKRGTSDKILNAHFYFCYDISEED